AAGGDGLAALGLDRVERIGVKLDERFRDRLVARRIRSALPEARVESWREYNRAIFGALRLEKTMMMVLVGLIFIVVAVNIYQSLRRSVVERTEEIGVLKALGAPPRPLQLVFVLEGLMIGLAGGLSGLVLGLAVSLNINAIFRAAEFVVNAVAGAGQWITAFFAGGGADGGATFSIFNPAYFYLEEVPAVVVPVEVAGVVLFAVASATVAAYAASRRVSEIAPADVLRYE
ncbi:MAG: ABC transporter permease, partial [bacterium]